MPAFENPFQRPIKKPPAQAEAEAGNYLVTVFRLAGVAMPYKRDVQAVARAGELLRRRWRNLTLRP